MPAGLTWDFNPLICVTNCPNVHHHVHPTSCKVLIIRGPGQGDWFGVVSIVFIFDLEERKMVKALLKLRKSVGADCSVISIYRIVICHRIKNNRFLVVDDSQVSPVIRISHPCDL